MTTPGATYRLQLRAGVDFAGAAELVGYLADLGVTHLYLSPILTAATGSAHGYDVADPRRVDAELGGAEGLELLSRAARAAGLGLVIDVVPNHVGTVPENPFWEDLLAHGRAGPAGRTFDVDWTVPLPGAAGKVILPVLGDQYGRVLVDGELGLVHDGRRWRVRYHEHSFPLSPASQRSVEAAGGAAALAGRPGDPASWARLHALLEEQHYRLVHWRAGPHLVNYRRFFAIDDLAAVRVEDPEIFDATHATIVDLVTAGVVDGLRIDHPDGLRDPGRYLDLLSARTNGAWTVVEKVCEPGEVLPDWPVAGTTGYEFTNDVLGLFVDPAAAAALDALDARWGASPQPYAAQAGLAKREKLGRDLAADLARLARALWRVAQAHLEARDIAEDHCRAVLADVLVAMDVYRPYVDPRTGEAGAGDVAVVGRAVARARAAARAPAFAYDLVEDVLLGRAGTDAAHLEVLARFAQLSSAVMAKGVEDTVFYRYRRLLAVNEVGGDPAHIGRTVAQFHAANAERAREHPRGMVTTATHDTKRGEDVRLRMAALSEVVGDWSVAVGRWRELNSELVTATEAGPAPDPQTEYLVYQTLVGIWPLSGRVGPDLVERLTQYVLKASREAGERTSWTDPDERFEDGIRSFVAGALDGDRSPGFLVGLDDLAAHVQEIAMVSGLAQTLLRCTAPGVPDCYQGNELWDDSLVDPDNRRPVDFEHRQDLLAALDGAADPHDLLARRRDGRVKLWVLSRALRARRTYASAVGPEGVYEPLATAGRWADHAVAYARGAPGGDALLLVVVPRLPGRVMATSDPPVGDAWADTEVLLPEGLRGRSWDSLLTEERYPASTSLAVSDVLGCLPVALLAAS